MNKERIDNFLKILATLRMEYTLSSSNIYHELINIDIDDDNYNKSISGENQSNESTFSRWYNYYKDNPNIDAFVSPNWRYFCQFISRDEKAKNTTEHIKIYIPLDINHIEEGAKKIFDFITDNNISHVSKIGSKIRFDNIVIRVTKEKDAEKIIEFVNSDSYLKEGLIKPNPFAFQKDGIALACDGNISYNDTLAQLIKLYLDDCAINKKLYSVSSKDFYDYISKLFFDQFHCKTTNILGDTFGFNNESSKSTNYYQVISLIIKASKDNFSLEDFYSHYNLCKIVAEEREEKEKSEIDKLLLESIEAMIKRFNSTEDGIHNVLKYIITGRVEYLTRDGNLRDKISSSTMRENILRICSEKHITVNQYIDKVIKRNGYGYSNDNNYATK